MGKNKFIPGLLTGLVGALFVFTVALTILVSQTDLGKAEGSKINSNSSISDTGDEDASTNTESNEIMSKLSLLESIIDKYYLDEIDEEGFADGIYKGLLSSLGDPYSTYYTAEEYTSLMESSSGIYCGIGATVSQNVNTGVISIVKPFITGPAYEVGILPGDILYKVDGEEVTGVDLTEVVSNMKGTEGTSVVITVIREGEDDPIDYTIIRRMIEVPTIEYNLMDDKIGYISVAEFDEVTSTQFKDAVKDLKDQGMVGLVIDLRNNPGGRLDTVVDMLDFMLPKGLIVYTEDKYGHREEERSTNNEKFELPLAVLINENSASASEVFAGAIQDYGTGTIVGTTSFGKGIVQSIIPLYDGTAVKVTVSKYYTPNGRNIHEIGITPDVEVELNEELKQLVVIDQKKDNQLQEAVKVISELLDK